MVLESEIASCVTIKLTTSPSVTPAASAVSTAMETLGCASLSKIVPVAEAVPIPTPVGLTALVMVAVKVSVGSSALSSMVGTSTVNVAVV